MTVKSRISIAEADDILRYRNNEWISSYDADLKLTEALEKEAQRTQLKEDDTTTPFWEIPDIKMEALLALAESRDHFMIEENTSINTTFFAYRLKKNFIVKIGPMFSESIFKILGIIVTVITTSYMATPAYLLIIGVPIGELIRTIFSYWERIEDPTEQTIFETIFRLSGDLSRENHDAIKELAFYRSAYKYISPSKRAIYESLSTSNLSHHQIDCALKSLKYRNILVEKEDKWNIRF